MPPGNGSAASGPRGTLACRSDTSRRGLEAEREQFHERVRAAFLAMARDEPRRYLVLDASLDQAQLSKRIQAAVRDLLPDPVPERAEEITGSLPVIRE